MFERLFRRGLPQGDYLKATAPEEALKGCREFWQIPIEGNVGMDQDPDKPFSGDNILVKGVVRVWKAGRVCLMSDMELDIGAGVDDSDYELDEADVYRFQFSANQKRTH